VNTTVYNAQNNHPTIELQTKLERLSAKCSRVKNDTVLKSLRKKPVCEMRD